MAILSEGLTIVIDASTAGFRKGLDTVKRSAAQTAAAVKRSSVSMVDSLDRVKAFFEKLRGVVLFVGIAIGGLVVPGLKAEDSLKKLSAANVLASKSTHTLRGDVKATADALGKTYFGAADKARVGVLKFAQTTKGALAGVAAATEISRIGLASEESAFQTLAQTALSLNRPLETTADQLKSDLAKAAVLSASSVEELGGAVQELSRPTLTLQTDVSTLLGTIVGLRKDGASLAETVSIIGSAMQSTISPTQEQAAAWRELGLEASPLLFYGDRVGSTMALMKDAVVTNSDAVRTLIGDSEGLVRALQGFGGGGGGFVQNLEKMESAAVDFSKAVERGESTLDKIKGLIPGLVNSISDLTAEMGLWRDIANEVRGVFLAIGKGIDYVLTKAGELSSTLNLPQAYDIASTAFPFLPKFADGGIVPGSGDGDKVPALLEPGEFVVRKTVAQAVGPFLQQLNSLGIRPSALLNTNLARVTLKNGDNLLREVLGITRPQGGRLPIAPEAINLAARTGKGANQHLAEIAASIFRTVEALPLRSGGRVPAGPVLKMRTGGPVPTPSPSGSRPPSSVPSGSVKGDTHLHLHGDVNMNLRGRELSPTVIRDKVVPGLEREFSSGRSRRSRTRR